MQCPRCQVKISGTHCPNCGFTQAYSENRVQPSEKPESGPQDFSDSQLVAKELAETTDWRSQIKRKVGEHTGNLAPDGSLNQPDRPNQESEDAGGSLFDYKLSEPGNKTRMPKVVRFSRKGSASPEFTEKPLIRTPVGSPDTVRPQVPKQQALTLNVPLAPPEASSPAVEKSGESAEIGISNEVILSRLLAGMIDLVFPFLIAFIFTLSASYILNFELISTSSVRLGALVSICFFFLNSFFFLILSGQTPGMYLTDLQLVGEDSKEVSFPALMLRVFLFLPLAVTVLGLFWCVGDPWCRCAHDRISRTRIIPIDPQN